MPIRVQNDLPVKEILEQENIFVMDEYRAAHQDIRPLSIGLLNLMPLKEDTELQILRSLSNTPIQVDVTFVRMTSHVSKNTSTSHIYKFYEPFESIREKKFDGFIITGAPVEQMPFEEVDYWEELKKIMEWTKTNVTSTLHLCWGAQAGIYYSTRQTCRRSCPACTVTGCATEGSPLSVDLTIYSWRLIPDIRKCHRTFWRRMSGSRSLRIPARPAYSSAWRRKDGRYSLWAIRNMTA